MAFASLVVSISGNIQSLEKELKTASARVQSFGNSLQSVGSALALGVTAPIAGFAAAALHASGEIQALKLALDSITRSSQETAIQFARLRELAKLPGLGLTEVAKGSVQLQSIGQSAQTAERWIKAFGNAIAAVGGGKAEFAGAVVQLQQMSNKSKVLAEDLKPLLNNIPQIGRIMRENFGAASSEELGKMGVSAKQFLEVVVRELEKIPQVGGGIKNSFENLSDSVKDSMAKAGDALAPFATKFINEFAEPALKKIGELAKGFQALQPQTQSFIVAAGGVSAVAPIVIVALGNLISNLALLSTAWRSAGGAAGIFSSALAVATSRFTLYGAAAATALPSIVSLVTAQNLAGATAIQGSQLMENLRKKLVALRVDGVNELAAAYDAGNISTEEYRQGLLNLANSAAPKVAQAIPKAKEEVKKFGDVGLAVAKEKAQPLLEKMKAMGGESGNLARIYEILRGEQERLGDEIARSSLNLERGKTGWLDFGEAMGLAENAFFKTKVGLDSIEASIDAFVKRAASASVETRQAFDDFKAVADLDKVVNQQRGKAGFARTKSLLADQIKDQGKELSAFSRQVSLVSNDLARDLAKLAVSGGKFAESVKNAFKSLGESLVRLALERQIGRIVNLVLDLTSRIKGMDKVIGAVFGGGSNAAGSAAGAVASSAGSAAAGVAGSAGSVAGGAASGALGIVGAVAGVATAVSSIISNFQFAGMNKSLDVIVRHTLETSLQLQHLQASANMWWPKLGMIHDRLAQILTTGIGVYNASGDQGLRLAGAVAGGGNGNTFNFYVQSSDPRAVTEEIHKYLKRKGL